MDHRFAVKIAEAGTSLDSLRIMSSAGTGSSPHRTDPGRHSGDVDRVRTGKSPIYDPAAAPVHTDAEAGHDAPRAASAAAAQVQHAAPEQVRATHTNPGRGQTQIPERRMAWLMALGFTLLILLGLMVAIVTLP